MHALVVDALATYRLSRLLQRDTFPPAVALRDVVRKRAPGPVAEVWECPWCLPLYVGLTVAVLRRTVPRKWDIIADSLAIGAVASLLLTAVERKD